MRRLNQPNRSRHCRCASEYPIRVLCGSVLRGCFQLGLGAIILYYYTLDDDRAVTVKGVVAIRQARFTA